MNRRDLVVLFGAVTTVASSMAMAQPAVAVPASVPSDQGVGDTPSVATRDPEISVVIVTAQKRAESVQEVPISVTVVSAAQLERRGVQSVQDLSQDSASLEFTAPAAAPGGGAFVRGIGTSALGGPTATASVGIVLDGVVLGNANVTDIFDVERVEVLKGPQGTLFGSSVSAGVISITSKAPQIGQKSAELSSEITLAPLGSEYSRRVLRGAVNLPVSDNSALRIAAHAYSNSGNSFDTATGADSKVTSYGVRARYLHDFSDSLRFNFIADYGRTDSDNTPALIYRFAPSGSPLEAALRACGIVASPDNVDDCSGLPQSSVSEVGGISGQFDLTLGENTLTSITSYRRTHSDVIADVIGIEPNAARSVFSTACNFVNCQPIVSLTTGDRNQSLETKRNLFTQEVRLTSSNNKRFEWVVGAFFQRATFDVDQPSVVTVHPSFSPVDLTAADAVQLANATASDYALFGNSTLYLSPSTRLIAGTRYTYSDIFEGKSVATSTDFAPPGTPPFVQQGSRSTTDRAITWRLGMQQDLGPNSMIYATASTGYKSPQINDGTVSGSPVIPMTVVKAERPISFETGVKHAMFDNRLFVNAAAYYSNVKDFQAQSCLPSSSTGIDCSIVNVPSVKTKGVELEVFGRPWTGMSLNATAAYTNAKYPAGFRGADATLMSGQQLNYAPKYKVTLSAEQEMPLNQTYSLVVGGDATFRGEQSQYLSALPIFVVPATSLFNARVGIRSKDDWSLFLFGRNLTNKVYPTQLFPTDAFHPGGVWHALDANSQRVVGLQLQGKF
jgi:iron complex outermembrane receptor protein